MSHSLRSSTARLAVLLCGLAVALSVLPGAAVAATGVGGAAIGQSAAASADTVVGADETVDGDLTVSSGDVVVHGTVEGDVTALSGSVRVTGEVTGDVSAAAGSVTVTGTVGEDVSAAAGSVEVGDGATVGGGVSAGGGSVTVAPDATVEGDVSDGGGSVQVESGATVEGSASAGGGSVLVEEGATVRKDVSAGGGDAQIHGTVEGDVASGDTVVLGSAAVVGGDVTYREGIDRAAGATVEGTVEQREGEWSVGGEFTPDIGLAGVLPDWLPASLDGVYWVLLALATGGALLALFPEFTTEVANQASAEPVRTGVAGFGALLAVPFLLVAFFVSVVGIPIALAGGALFGLAVWAGLVYGEYLVGRRLLAAAGRDHRWVALAAGVLGVEAVSLLPLVGDLVTFLVLLVGLGALALAVTARWRDERDGPAEGATPPPTDPSTPA